MNEKNEYIENEKGVEELNAQTISKEEKFAPCHKGMGPKLNFYIDSE